MTNDFIVQAHQHSSIDRRTDKIAIVNISDLPDEDIRKQVQIVAKYEPAAIGIDYFMPDRPDSMHRRLDFKNIVLPIGIRGDSAWFPINYYSNQNHFGSISIYSPSYFEPFVVVGDNKYPLLPTKLIQLYDSRLYKQLLTRKFSREVINYLGDTDSFDYLGDLTELHHIERLEALKGKIVLLGYTGVESVHPTRTDTLDSHSTPRGKMYGVVVLANIIHTLMDNYINPLTPGWNYCLVALLTLFNTVVAFALFPKLRLRYWIIKLVQVISILLVFTTASMIINRFNILVDYESLILSVLVSPEITIWYAKLFKVA